MQNLCIVDMPGARACRGCEEMARMRGHVEDARACRGCAPHEQVLKGEGEMASSVSAKHSSTILARTAQVTAAPNTQE